MDKSSSSLNSSTLSNDVNTRSKLRRLRIEEALILQSLQKLGGNSTMHEDYIEINETDTLDYNNFLKKVKNDYINVKNIYDELKCNTTSQELLADLDIEDMKKKVFELETSIKTLKSQVNVELAALKLNEQELNKQINENLNEIENTKKQRKRQSANYNTLVPSPVRVMMTSPFKSMEVQRFQDFMKNSQNRCGGWNEYNHNIFVKYWQKYFGKSYSSALEDGVVQKTLIYENFVEDVTPRLHGIKPIDINAHVKWYVEYLYLKEHQQNAINKWKGNQNSVKKLTKKVNCTDDITLESTLDDRNFIACNFDAIRCAQPEATRALNISRAKSFEVKRELQRRQRPILANSIMKPTKQWVNRIQENVEQSVGFNTVEQTIQKL